MRSSDKAIEYQAHALNRMASRGISKEQVTRAVRNGKRGSAKRPNSIKFTHKVSRKTTIVVIAQEDQRTIWVITAFKK